MAMTDEEKKLTAYHEAGHALVAMHVPKSDPLHKVTIIPRGRALGVTMQLPERDHLSHTKQFLESRLAIMFGGRIAEEIIFGPENVTTGAASDIQVATQTARGMITAFGMSEKLGRVRYQANEQEVFLGHAVTQTQNVSEATAQLIDQEVRRLIEEAEGKAKPDPDRPSGRPAPDRQGAARVRDAEQRRDRPGPARREDRARRHRRRRLRRRSPPPRLGADQQRPGHRPVAGRRQSRAAAGRLTASFRRPLARSPEGDGDRECDARTPFPTAANASTRRRPSTMACVSFRKAPTSSMSAAKSTRPGSRPTAPDEELQRVLPVVEGLARRGVVVSIDTRRAAVARACLDAGARIVNDVSALAGRSGA